MHVCCVSVCARAVCLQLEAGVAESECSQSSAGARTLLHRVAWPCRRSLAGPAPLPVRWASTAVGGGRGSEHCVKWDSHVHMQASQACSMHKQHHAGGSSCAPRAACAAAARRPWASQGRPPSCLRVCMCAALWESACTLLLLFAYIMHVRFCGMLPCVSAQAAC